jgi:hypothetical protein
MVSSKVTNSLGEGFDGTSEFLPLVALGGNIDAFSRLVSVGYDPSDYNNAAIINAAIAGQTSMVKFLLKYPNVNPSVQSNSAIRKAIEFSFIEEQNHEYLIITEILLNDSRVDPNQVYDMFYSIIDYVIEYLIDFNLAKNKEITIKLFKRNQINIFPHIKNLITENPRFIETQ